LDPECASSARRRSFYLRHSVLGMTLQPNFSLVLSTNHHSIHSTTRSMATQAASVTKRNLFALIVISVLARWPTTFIWHAKNKWKVNAASCTTAALALRFSGDHRANIPELPWPLSNIPGAIAGAGLAAGIAKSFADGSHRCRSPTALRDFDPG
jgi:hypothetical protein